MTVMQQLCRFSIVYLNEGHSLRTAGQVRFSGEGCRMKESHIIVFEIPRGSGCHEVFDAATVCK